MLGPTKFSDHLCASNEFRVTEKANRLRQTIVRRNLLWDGTNDLLRRDSVCY